MKLIVLMMLAPLALTSCIHTQAKKSPSETSIVELTEANMALLGDAVNDQTALAVQIQLLKLDKIQTDEPIYLVLNTPGGSIDAGLKIYETAKALRRKTHTITINAASMGFFLTQMLGERLVVPSGRYLAHQVKISVHGQSRTEFITRWKAEVEFINWIESVAATRMGISLTSYQKLADKEIQWLGETSVVANVADRVVIASCNESLTNQRKRIPVQLRNGLPAIAIMSGCPLMLTPLDLVFQ